MQNAEWSGRAGADQWNVGVAHNDDDCLCFGCPAGAGECLKITISTKANEPEARRQSDFYLGLFYLLLSEPPRYLCSFFSLGQGRTSAFISATPIDSPFFCPRRQDCDAAQPNAKRPLRRLDNAGGIPDSVALAPIRHFDRLSVLHRNPGVNPLGNLLRALYRHVIVVVR